jgi:2-polyprenyl-3-methyl-5-hydroxy-6-metoxy-1,4-benzoquinol methylase
MKKEYEIITDPMHGFLRIDPIPTEKEVEEYYLKEFYSTNYKQFNDSSLEVQRDEQDFFDSRWENYYLKIQKHFGPTNDISVFDIGFGYAQTLLYFHNKGLKVSGIEPSKEGVDYAKQQGLTDIYQGSIEDYSCVGERRFEVVTLINVLEHLRDPYKILIDIKQKLLKTNGMLIIDVPNEFNDFQVIANNEYHLNEWWLAPPAHINYFSATSLKNLLMKTGYKILFAESSFPLELFLLFGDIYVGNNDLGRQCHLKRVKFEKLMNKYGKYEKLSQFYQAFANLDLGRQITLFAINIK